MRVDEIPTTGLLSGLKVVCVGMNTAGPYAVSMLADFGADVVFVESPIVTDQYRTTDTRSLLNKERRNMRDMVLNVVKPEGREVLTKLLAEADIFLENSKSGTWDKRGFSDEELWKINPSLVICHVTGFGQTGDETTLSRGSYDHIGQAFSGFTALNGTPGTPMPAPAYLGDYVPAMLASWACLAAVYNAQRTGRGESIDVAQFEALLQISAGFPSDWLNYEKERPRAGSGSPIFAGSGPYRCADGYIYVHFASTPTLRDGLPLLGLEYGSEDYPDEPTAYFVPKGSSQGLVVEERLREFCADRPVGAVEESFNAHSIVCTPILSYEQMKDHPHFVERGVFFQWEGIDGDQVWGPRPAPKLTNNPATIWRRAPYYGEDNRDILSELGYSDSGITELYEKGILEEDDNL